MSDEKKNPMQEIRIEKVTLNIGAGKDQKILEKGVKLLNNLTGRNPIKTITQKRIAAWGLRAGLPIGCKVTLRKGVAYDVLSRTLDAKSNMLNSRQFDNNGNLAFGVPEYIDIKDARYDPDIGMMGLEVCVTLERPGYRIKRRSLLSKKIPAKHKVTKEDAINFMQTKFKVELEDEQGEE
jgi:large subunit ribosomal protein L5